MLKNSLREDELKTEGQEIGLEIQISPLFRPSLDCLKYFAPKLFPRLCLYCVSISGTSAKNHANLRACEVNAGAPARI
jgi:hypothetical protein